MHQERTRSQTCSFWVLSCKVYTNILWWSQHILCVPCNARVPLRGGEQGGKQSYATWQFVNQNAFMASVGSVPDGS